MNKVKKSKPALIEEQMIIEEAIQPKTIEKNKNKNKNGTDSKKTATSTKTKKNIDSEPIAPAREISEFDEYLFHEGSHVECYSFMGAHFVSENRKKGVRFTTWAPNASAVHVVGSFSNWEMRDEYKLTRFNTPGLWTIFIPGLQEGTEYKLAISSNNRTVYKADPYAFKAELRPNTASLLTHEPKYRWTDKKWINKRAKANIEALPVNTYELQLASWKTKDGSFMSYDELSEILPSYIKEMGYTHVELMPLTEYPLDASWGYQATGYYSPTARHGEAVGLKKLINNLHKEDIGVILDWVPGHFCKDEHGLFMFDGTPTYEYAAWWKADNKGWGTCNFDLGRPEVKSFLISNAAYWIKEFHIDGLRVDAVSNMLYLNYGRESGEWEPNCYGDSGNLEGIQFLKDFNKQIKGTFPGVITIAEESTAWPNITAPVEDGGLGFSFKWNMGWMNDTLRYVKLDPVHRKYHHNLLNFSMMYNYSEKFVLPISHDEVVHGKGSLINKMWGDNWNKYAGLRLYSSFMMAHPGKKLLFMGSEFGQFIEWREYEGLQWHVIDEYEIHKQTHNYFKTLNKFYVENKALWELDYDPKGFQWLDADNSEKSILTFMRKSNDENETLIYICNFTPVVYYDFNIGVPNLGEYEEVFNTDALEFGGAGQIMTDTLMSRDGEYNNQPYTLTIKVPPMAVSVLKFKNNI